MDKKKTAFHLSRKEPEYEYYVWPERRILLRASVEAVEQFCPAADEEWQANPALEGLRSGSGDFDFFDRVSEEEAMAAAARFREAAGVFTPLRPVLPPNIPQ